MSETAEGCTVTVCRDPTPTARRRGATPVWFGLVLSPDIEADLVSWVRSGGPGVADLPPVLDLSVIPAPGR